MRDQRCDGDIAEEWRDIAGYEGLYQVSNLGRVKSLPKYNIKDPKILSLINVKNYHNVNLFRDKTQRRHQVHRLVAKAFLPNPDNLPVVNHIDGNGLNNNVENLEWCTQSYNTVHAIRIGRLDPTLRWKASAKVCSKKVVRDDGVVFESGTAAAKALGVDQANISRCLCGKRKQTKGHSFSYYEEETA